MGKKNTLICVEPGGKLYVSADIQTWTFRLVSEACGACGKHGAADHAFVNQDNGAIRCGECVDMVSPGIVLQQYETAGRLTEILERFNTTLINCEAEFKRHLPEKEESWLQDGTDVLFTNVQHIAAKLLLADGRDFQVDKTIDLILSAMMLAERYLRDDDKDEDDIPF